MSTGGKAWLFTLFQLFTSISESKQEAAYKNLTGAHPLPVSGNANRTLVLSDQLEVHLFLAPRSVTGDQL